jgi:hypothetical protein
VTQGEKRATAWSGEDSLPAWLPDGMASLLQHWPAPQRVTAAELDACNVAAADAIVDFCATEARRYGSAMRVVGLRVA